MESCDDRYISSRGHWTLPTFVGLKYSKQVTLLLIKCSCYYFFYKCCQFSLSPETWLCAPFLRVNWKECHYLSSWSAQKLFTFNYLIANGFIWYPLKSPETPLENTRHFGVFRRYEIEAVARNWLISASYLFGCQNLKTQSFLKWNHTFWRSHMMLEKQWHQ